MQQSISEDIIKIQNKGVLTIPKGLRAGLLADNTLVRIKKEKGRLIIEPLRTLPYPVRSYTDSEIKAFIATDRKDSRELKKKKLI